MKLSLFLSSTHPIDLDSFNDQLPSNDVTLYLTVFLRVQVERRTYIPMVAIAVVTIIPALLALIYIGSPSVFEDVVSLSTSGLYASYFVVCSLLLWRRVTGQIRAYNTFADRDGDDENYSPPPPIKDSTSSGGAGENVIERKSRNDDDDNDHHQRHQHLEVIAPKQLLTWGPWKVPGIWGTINNAYACVYILFVLFWSFWPPQYPATPQNMNYSILMTGAVLILSVVYYYPLGRRHYRGPLVEREATAHVNASG